MPQGQGEGVSAAGAQGVPDGGFQQLLDRKMLPAAPDVDPRAAVESAPAGLAADLQPVLQGFDPTGMMIAPPAMFPAGQAIAVTPPVDPAGVAAAAEGTGGVELGLAREFAAQWRMFDDAGGGGGDAGPDERGGDRSQAALAAMSADVGKRLPQLPADAQAALHALVADAALREAVPGDSQPLPAAGDSPSPAPVTGSGIPAASALAGASEVRPAALAQVATPFGRPEWADAMGERVTWLVGQRIQSADIQITPPQLGPVEVRISIQDDQASLFFSSSHAVVRDAIQAALPRLNEMLAQSGLTLGQTSVGAESFAGQREAHGDSGRRGRDAQDGPRRGDAGAGPGDPGSPHVVTMLRGRPGIDMFV
jgi:flagellar hook-length control protein FliK